MSENIGRAAANIEYGHACGRLQEVVYVPFAVLVRSHQALER